MSAVAVTVVAGVRRTRRRRAALVHTALVGAPFFIAVVRRQKVREL